MLLRNSTGYNLAMRCCQGTVIVKLLIACWERGGFVLVQTKTAKKENCFFFFFLSNYNYFQSFISHICFVLVWPSSFLQQLECHASQTSWCAAQAHENVKDKYLKVTVVKFVLPKKLLQYPQALIYWAAICIALFKSPQVSQQQEDLIKGINNVSHCEAEYLPASGENSST